MAEYGYQWSETFQTSQDLSQALYHGVTWVSQWHVGLASNPADRNLIGVLQNKVPPPISGAPDMSCTVAYHGRSKMVAGGAVSAGSKITVNGSGRAAAVASGGMCIGTALEASSADGNIISVLLMQPTPWF
jgi:hypothetical protein